MSIARGPNRALQGYNISAYPLSCMMAGAMCPQPVFVFRQALSQQGVKHRARLSKEHGRAYAKKIWNYLNENPCVKKLHCDCCGNQLCDVHPPRSVQRGRKYINIAGTMCVPWSMGRMNNWLHECTQVFMTFLTSVNNFLPRVFSSDCLW